MIRVSEVETVLARVRPFLRADGGDVELVGLEGNSAAVRFLGRCAECPTAHITLFHGIEGSLRRAIPDFGSVRLVRDTRS